MTPSETLTAAADRVRDLAAKTTTARSKRLGWGHLDRDELGDPSSATTVVLVEGWGGADVVADRVAWADAEWIAALSPAVAPHVEKILRQAAFAYGMGGDSQQDENALALARAVLGEKEEQ